MSYGQPLSVGDKLFGQTTLAGDQSSVIKKTYVLLGLSVAAAVAGVTFGLNAGVAQLILNTGIIGWIVIMVALNVIPYVAMAARHSTILGPVALLADGFLSGIVISPMILIATQYMGTSGSQAVFDACVITGIIFLSITGYVMTSKRTFSAPRALMTGLFFGTIGLVGLNIFFNSPIVSLLISGAIGIIGVFMLVSATSDVLNNPEADSPIPGALMLFAGLFNVFVAVLSILMSFGGDD